MAPVTTGHADSEHLLIAYGIVLLRWWHAPGLKGNWVPMAITSGLIAFRTAHCAFHTTLDLVLLL
jgi:hypothetical protein